MATKVKLFQFAFNSKNRAVMILSPYELAFDIKPKKPIMFNLSSTTDSFRIYQPSQSSPCTLFQNTHTTTFDHHPQIKKLKEGNFAHRFPNCKKITQKFITKFTIT